MSFTIGLWQYSDSDDVTKICSFQHLFGIFMAVFDTIEKNGNEKCTTIIIGKCTTLQKFPKSRHFSLFLCHFCFIFCQFAKIQFAQKLQFFAVFLSVEEKQLQHVDGCTTSILCYFNSNTHLFYIIYLLYI